MTVAFYMNTVTAHQLPLAREVVKLVGPENFRYIDFGYEGKDQQNRKVSESWITRDRGWLETADVVLTGMRDIDLLERRAAKGLKTYLTAERWLKPYAIGFNRNHTARRIFLPGWLKLLSPGFRKVIKRLVKVANENECVKLLPIGPHAWADFKLMGVREDKMVPWGYYVEPSTAPRVINDKCNVKSGGTLKVLWVGRELWWKRADDVKKACARVDNVELTMLSGVSMDEVRKAMREHDTFVLASNSYEGWGAVLSEALEEGMNAIGTYEAGASAAMLPKDRLYHAGDVKVLAKLLEKERCGELSRCSIGMWSAAFAAKRILEA